MEVAHRATLAQEFGVAVIGNPSPSSRPRIRARANGIIRSSAVPGGTVDRMTTVCGPVLSRMAGPIWPTTASIAPINTLPSGALGVPTEMKETSVCRTASATLYVAVSLPRWTASAMRRSIFSSTIGERPANHRDLVRGDVDANDLMTGMARQPH